MAPETPVRQQKGTEARAVVTSLIFMEVLRGDNALLLFLSYLTRQDFHWGIVMVWQDINGQEFRGFRLAQTLYRSIYSGQWTQICTLFWSLESDLQGFITWLSYHSSPWVIMSFSWVILCVCIKILNCLLFFTEFSLILYNGPFPWMFLLGDHGLPQGYVGMHRPQMQALGTEEARRSLCLTSRECLLRAWFCFSFLTPSALICKIGMTITPISWIYYKGKMKSMCEQKNFSTMELWHIPVVMMQTWVFGKRICLFLLGAEDSMDFLKVSNHTLSKGSHNIQTFV